MAKNKIIVVGGGLSGLMATLKICEAGGEVDLFSYCPVKRSHSLCAQGGINACMDTKGEHDSIYEHFDDTVYGGDFLALIVFAGIREQQALVRIPKGMQGVAIVMVTAALLSLAFMGFSGVDGGLKALFGLE